MIYKAPLHSCSSFWEKKSKISWHKAIRQLQAFQCKNIVKYQEHRALCWNLQQKEDKVFFSSDGKRVFLWALVGEK